MNSKLVGMLCAVYSMLAGLIYVLCGFIGNMWDTAWIVFVVSGVACGITAVIGGYIESTKKDKKK